MTTTDLLQISLARRAGVTGEGRRLRKAAGLSLRNVAALLGCDSASLARYEVGSARPGVARARVYGEWLAQRLAVEAAEAVVDESEALALV